MVDEKSPPGWSGTTKAMKKHRDISDPFALSWWMKKKGYHPHHKPEGKEERLENLAVKEAVDKILAALNSVED